MIPLRDNIASQRQPVVSLLLIGSCAVVFLMQLAQSDRPGEPGLTSEYGMIPFRITHPGEPFEIPVGRQLVRTPWGVEERLLVKPAGPAAVPPLLTPLTCIFLHGGWMHIIGNLWFLWIFGDNVEDSMGAAKYLLFYLVGGAAASLIHVLTNPGSQIPTVGASGAISAVLGAYLVLYPHSRVLTIIPLGFFLRLTLLPASIVLGLWFALQLFSGLLSLGGPDVGGVAFWAHVGGFVAGVVLAKLFASRRRPEYYITW